MELLWRITKSRDGSEATSGYWDRTPTGQRSKVNVANKSIQVILKSAASRKAQGRWEMQVSSDERRGSESKMLQLDR